MRGCVVVPAFVPLNKILTKIKLDFLCDLLQRYTTCLDTYL